MSRKPLQNLSVGAVQRTNDNKGDVRTGAELLATDEPTVRAATVHNPGLTPNAKGKGKNIKKSGIDVQKVVIIKRNSASAVAPSGEDTTSRNLSQNDAISSENNKDSMALKRGFQDVGSRKQIVGEIYEDFSSASSVGSDDESAPVVNRNVEQTESGSPSKRVKSDNGIMHSNATNKAVITMGDTAPGRESAFRESDSQEQSQPTLGTVAKIVQDAHRAEVARGPIATDQLLNHVDIISERLEGKKSETNASEEGFDIEVYEQLLKDFREVKQKTATVANENMRFRTFDVIADELKAALKNYPESLKKIEELRNVVKYTDIINSAKNLTVAAQQAHITMLEEKIPQSERKKLPSAEGEALSMTKSRKLDPFSLSSLENTCVKETIQILLASDLNLPSVKSVIAGLTCQLREERQEKEQLRSEVLKLQSEMSKLRADKLQAMYEMSYVQHINLTSISSPAPNPDMSLRRAVYASPNKTRGLAMTEMARRKSMAKMYKS